MTTKATPRRQAAREGGEEERKRKRGDITDFDVSLHSLDKPPAGVCRSPCGARKKAPPPPLATAERKKKGRVPPSFFFLPPLPAADGRQGQLCKERNLDFKKGREAEKKRRRKPPPRAKRRASLIFFSPFCRQRRRCLRPSRRRGRKVWAKPSRIARRAGQASSDACHPAILQNSGFFQ